MKDETMTYNGKAMSKVTGWEMILNIISDRNGAQETGERQ
jgi:hypothetical protein